MKMGPQSLGQSLPPVAASSRSRGSAARADGERLVWTGRSAAHVIRVARVAEEAPASGPSPGPPCRIGDGRRLRRLGRRRRPRRRSPGTPRARRPSRRRHRLAGDDGQTSLDSTGPEDGEEPAGGRLVGRLVHRLLARFPPGPAADEAIVLATVQALVTDEERAQVPELDAAIARAVALHRRLASRPDVQALFAGGTAAFEVPVSLVQDGRVLRGTIDCLIRRPDGALVVVEVKTGPPRPEHQRQLEAYLGAIQALGPAIRATGCLVHP